MTTKQTAANTPTPGPIMLWTSNSWRRIGTADQDRIVCEPIVQRSDGHPDLHFRNGGESGPDARLLIAAWNSYRKLPDPIAAAESDLLGDALEALRCVVAEESEVRDRLNAAGIASPSNLALVAGRARDVLDRAKGGAS